MKYVFLAAFALAIFGLCFLVDLLLKKLTPDDPRKRTGKVVRPPRRGSIFGVLLLFFGFSAILFYSNRMEPIWIVLCALVAIFGGFLLAQDLSCALYYDAEGFTYRDLKNREKAYRYDQIEGQRSELTRAGVQTTIYVAGDTIRLYEAMDGLRPFLETAFRRWCEEKKIDPQTVEHNPEYLTYFPDPEKA